MRDDRAFTGLPLDLDKGRLSRWPRLLVRATLGVLSVGLVLAAILWVVTNHEVGALVVCIVFALSVGLMTIRQTILAERS